MSSLPDLVFVMETRKYQKTQIFCLYNNSTWFSISKYILKIYKLNFKQAKLLHLGHSKPARHTLKSPYPKRFTVWCGFWSRGIFGSFFLRKWARRDRYSQWRSLSSHAEQKKNRILATFGFNRIALRATQPKLHAMFCALFLKIALSAAELMSFGHLGTVICHSWTIICGVPTKISVTPTDQRQLTL